MTNDGKPYGPLRYKEIVRERWLIAKNSHITYTDTQQITPTERYYLLEFIAEDIARQQAEIDKAKEQMVTANSKK